MAMRRAADKAELQTRQDEAMELLSQIQAGYRHFHRLSLAIAEAHPNQMEKEVIVGEPPPVLPSTMKLTLIVPELPMWRGGWANNRGRNILR